MLNTEMLIGHATDYLSTCNDNYIQDEDAIREDLAGMRIFDDPIFAFGDASDPLFQRLQSIVHPGFMLPHDWVSDAKSVISYFLPFTDTVRVSNRQPCTSASDEWLHARIEGQKMLAILGEHICRLLTGEGYSAAFPTTDARFKMLQPYISNWSERHVAYICGLGTFGLSKGLITRKGTAGRFGSIITSCELPVTRRGYTGVYDYCTLCGKCQKNCPVQAIDIRKGIENAKDHLVCGPYVDTTILPPHGPNQRVRYGCGKCHVDVPCEHGIPEFTS
ncbi:4Fe-4S binding protein [Dehalobacter sp. DCM]|uniref:4Fe-4S binding protein n=1 Tax=Dehalobacter sp. DCM TaxID=2907827 RepID=UPI0030815E88|nr:4Fe-4S binding protein [Dehalobacter sp. DCM]